MKRALFLLALFAPLAAWGESITLSPLVGGLDSPVLVTHAGDGSGRIFIVQQNGLVRIWQNSALVSRPFLDIRSRISSGGERGLLGLAFHPRFAANRKLYVNYTDRSGNTVIAQYRVFRRNPNRVDTDTRRVLLRIRQPYANHNGGALVFGPDGYLYIATGDGGSAGDPKNSGQRLNTLLGKILRIDVNRGSPYGIPTSNPFRSRRGVKPEIWAYGFRNPWRFSFDLETARLFAGDVGQGRFEEIDLVQAGRNYGWRVMEASSCYVEGCSTNGLELPISEYGRDLGRSVTGGFVYRGSAVPELTGRYLFGDFISGRIWSLTEQEGSWTRSELLDTELNISAFGEDESREQYVVDYGGTVYKIVPEALGAMR